MTSRLKLGLPLALFFGFGGLSDARDLPKTDPPFERYYQFPLINGRSPAAPAMSPDGRTIVFGWNQTGERRLDVWTMDFPSGEKRRIVDAAKIEALPRQDDTRTELEKKEEELYDGGISGFQWSPDGREILFNYKGRVWTCRPDGSELEPIFDANLGVGSVQYSPDGRYIGYLSGANLFRWDRERGRIRQLTFVSRANTRVSGFQWAPNGQNIAVFWADEGKLGSHHMMDFSKDRATVVNIRRMWTGEQSNDQQIGIVPAEGGLIKWVEGLPRYLWTVGMEWSPDGTMLALAWTKDDFKEFTISVVPMSTMKRVDSYHEKAPKNYIVNWRPIVWERDSRHLLFGTDIIDGKFTNRSIMRMTASGRDLRPVYAEDHDVTSFMRPKHSDRLVMVTMARSPLLSEITILEPNGRRTVHRPVEDGMSTPKNFEDTGNPLVSEDGRLIATLASTRTMNAELFSVEPQIRRLTHSQLPEFQKVRWAEHRQVTFKAPDGEIIHAVLITKPGLDKSRKRPAFISNMYANSAKFAWNGFFENYAAMELDMVVLQIDFRSSWGKGGEFNSGYYRSMGLIDTDEAVAAKDFLVSLGYVDEDRVGVWGWSYGGFLTEMILFTKPGVFHAGVAVAPVTDWRSYNEWYTRRRLGLEKDDKEIYLKTSPINYPDGLQDHLLMIHGMLDPNVLFQDTARLMQALIERGRHFDLMLYPRDDHGIGMEHSRPHVFTTVMRYLNDKLNEPKK
jgi:dipeptidyl-peptidase 4